MLIGQYIMSRAANSSLAHFGEDRSEACQAAQPVCKYCGRLPESAERKEETRGKCVCMCLTGDQSDWGQERALQDHSCVLSWRSSEDWERWECDVNVIVVLECVRAPAPAGPCGLSLSGCRPPVCCPNRSTEFYRGSGRARPQRFVSDRNRILIPRPISRRCVLCFFPCCGPLPFQAIGRESGGGRCPRRTARRTAWCHHLEIRQHRPV